VLLADGTRWTAAEGLAQVDAGTPMTTTTPSRIASITKTFTAAAVLVLAERGALGLDDPAVEHLPELRALRTEGHRLDAVTVRRLLLHRSGLISEPPTRDWCSSPFPAIGEVLAQLDLAYLAIAPGSAFKYSNLGYALLGEIVARAAGCPCERFVRETLLEPAGMIATTFDPPAGAALGYGVRPDGCWVEQAAQELGAERPGGGMWSTVGDLLRWAEVALGRVPGVLSSATAALLARPETIEDSALSFGRSLGWEQWRSGERVLHAHAGLLTGFASHLAFDVASGCAAVVLANSHGTRRPACHALLGVEVAPPPPSPRVAPSSPRDPVGAYASVLDVTLYVERRGATLWLIGGGHLGVPSGAPLEPRGVDRLVVGVGWLAGEPLEFDRAADGSVTGFTVAGWRYRRR
jgi:CubicO group peptidase (beta-lactamase class C family)